MKTTHTKSNTHISGVRLDQYEVKVWTKITFDREKGYNWITTSVSEQEKPEPKWDTNHTQEIGTIYFPDEEVLEDYLQQFVDEALKTLEAIRQNKKMAMVGA